MFDSLTECAIISSPDSFLNHAVMNACDSLCECVIISKIDTLDVIVIIAVNDSLFNTATIYYH